MKFRRRNDSQRILVSFLLVLWVGIELSRAADGTADNSTTHYFTPPIAYDEGGTFDLWEPFLAASPDGKIALWSTTSYHDRYCKTHHLKDCASPLISYRLLNDQYELSDSIPLCVGTDSLCSSIEEQNDPVVAVTNEGLSYFIWMNDYNISVMRADSFKQLTNSGFNNQTFILNLQAISNECDKPWIAAYGDNVVAAYTDLDEGHLLIRGSNDRGVTWWQEREITKKSNEYHYPSGMFAGADGSFCLCTSEMPNSYDNETMKIYMNVFCATSSQPDAYWRQTVVDTSDEGPSCPDWARCQSPREYLMPSMAMAGDTVGSLYVLYALSVVPNHPSQLYFRHFIKGTDEWGDRTIASAVASHTVHHCFPMIAAKGNGDVRIAWMDNRTGAFNLWYRESLDWGNTWSEEVRISTDTSFAFQSQDGFAFPYGDYGSIIIDQQNNSVLTWGEGASWAGPGMTFIAFQLQHPKTVPEYSLGLVVTPAFFLMFAIGGLVYFFGKRKNNEQYTSLHQEDTESAVEATDQNLDDTSSSVQ